MLVFPLSFFDGVTGLFSRKHCTLLDCKTVGFFLKIIKEIGKAWRKSLTLKKRTSSPVSLSVFSLVPDLLFDCSPLLEYAKIRTVLQSSTLPTTLEMGKINN